MGVLLIFAGLVPAVHAFVPFTKGGQHPNAHCTDPAFGGDRFDRCVRNPMYVVLLAALVGEALLFGQLSLLLYDAAGWAVTASFVRWYEGPTLRRQFCAEYEAYRRAGPARR